MDQHTLYFYHDPMCSWCWGYRPTSDLLLANLPPYLKVEKVLGGLAPDSDKPMPAELKQKLPETWQRIHERLGTKFNFAFWTDCEPRRSTYPACRAVVAADYQNAGDQMIDAIQHAYYLRAMNPSDLATLESLAAELDLHTAKFAEDLRSEETEHELKRQFKFARRSPISGFPSLCLALDGELLQVVQDYEDYTATLSHVEQLIAAAKRKRG
jgi:putative protein-disulfide isomerase